MASPVLIFHPVSVCPDYFILENNSLLKAALRYKRIQITEYKTLQTDRFGKYLFLVVHFTISSQLFIRDIYVILFCNTFFFTP